MVISTILILFVMDSSTRFNGVAVGHSLVLKQGSSLPANGTSTNSPELSSAGNQFMALCNHKCWRIRMDDEVS